jgi:membrane protein required for colicin V production
VEYVGSLTTIASVSLRPYDMFALILLGVMLMFGAWKGMAWQIAQFASYVGSWYVAVNFSSTFAPMIGADPPWNRLIAMLVLFLGTSLLIWSVFSWISKLIDKVRLKDWDRQAGALLGLINGVLLFVVITFFGVMLSHSVQEKIFESTSGHFVSKRILKVTPFLPVKIREALSGFIDDYAEAVEDLPDEQPLLFESDEDELSGDDIPEDAVVDNSSVMAPPTETNSGASGDDSLFDLGAIRSWLEESGSLIDQNPESGTETDRDSGEEEGSLNSELRDFLDDRTPFRMNSRDLLDIHYEDSGDLFHSLPLHIESERAGDRESFQGASTWHLKRRNGSRT